MNRLRAYDPAGGLGQGGDGGPPADDDTRLGDLMRGERATLGKSLLDVQRELRIRASYVAAIENCDVSAFDAPSFIAGYVRSYARYLNMDPDWTFRRFCQESGLQPMHGMAPAASGPKPTRRPSDPAEALANPRALFIPQKRSFWSDVEPRAIGSVLVLMAVIAGLGYGGWSVLQEVQRVTLAPGDDIPAVVADLDPAQGAGLSDPPLVDTAGSGVVQMLPRPEAMDRLYRPQILEAPVLTARDGPIAAIDPGLPEVAALDEPATATPAAVAAAATPAAEAGTEADAAQAEGVVRTVALDAPAMELLAVRPAWVRVSSADGTVILEKIMDAGERFALPKLEEAPQLRTGNSGAVYFAVDGQTYGPAAPGAQVVSGIDLSADSVTGTFALADLSADPELAQMVAMAEVASAPEEPVSE